MGTEKSKISFLYNNYSLRPMSKSFDFLIKELSLIGNFKIQECRVVLHENEVGQQMKQMKQRKASSQSPNNEERGIGKRRRQQKGSRKCLGCRDC